MIVFTGKFVQTTWKQNHQASYNNYPWLYANPSGWMDSDTFFKWFEEWEIKTRVFEVVCISDLFKVYVII